MSEHFIFGYGSLINKKSREKTGESGEAIPCRVRNIDRRWDISVPRYHVTALGAAYDSTSVCNGVLVPVSESGILRFDERELPHGYSRVKLSREDVSTFEGSVPDGELWVYVTNNSLRPTEDNPIPQSYVDVIIEGCLGIGEDFAREFVSTTKWWEPWLNDRENPRYPRPSPDAPIEIIDRILEEVIPDAFFKRKKI